MIDDIKKQIRATFNDQNLFTEEWTYSAFLDTISIFKQQYNNRLEEKGIPKLEDSDFPTSPKTDENLTFEEVKTIIENAVVPPKQADSPFAPNNKL